MNKEKIEKLLLEVEELDNAIENLKKTIRNSRMSLKNIDNIIITVNSLREDWGDKRYQIFKLRHNIV
jgi:prefoldin subunit 5